MNSKLKISNNGLVLLLALNFTVLPLGGWFINKNTRTIAEIAQAQEGARTCFSRINQSFTAHMVGNSGSSYLGSDFFSTTEECLNEVGSLVKSLAVNKVKEIQGQLNEIKNETHWLHTYLKRSSGSVNIPERYEGIESLLDQSVDALEAEKRRVENNNLRAWKTTAGSFALLCLLMLYGLYMRWSELKAKRKWEAIAGEYGEDASEYIPSNLDTLFTESLKDIGLSNVSRAFANYHEYMLDGKIIPLGQPTSADHLAYLGYEKTNLTDILNDVLDLTSDQVFSKGILFDFNTDDQVYVYADREALQQMVYNLVSYAIEKCLLTEGTKKVIVRTKVLGSSVLLKVSHSGGTIDNGLVKALNRADSINAKDLDLRVSLCHELVSDLQGEMRCKYRRNKNDNIDGNIFEFVLHRVDQDDLPLAVLDSDVTVNREEKIADSENIETKKVIKVMKGTKKEILNQMNA